MSNYLIRLFVNSYCYNTNRRCIFVNMIIIFLLLAAILIGIILIFSSKKFSPVPYFPSNSKDMSLIINSLDLKNNQTVIDLGAGDGIVIFEAAKSAFEKKLNTQFVAVDINPILILILTLRRFFHPNKNNIKILQGDFFKLDFSFLTTNYNLKTTIYLYISPWFLDKVSEQVLQQIPNAKIVSYMYPIKSLRKMKKTIHGKNSIFIYS